MVCTCKTMMKSTMNTVERNQCHRDSGKYIYSNNAQVQRCKRKADYTTASLQWKVLSIKKQKNVTLY